MKNLKLLSQKAFPLIAFMAMAPVTHAQVTPPPVRPPVRPPVIARLLPTQLGSSAASAKSWGPDLQTLVKGALPTYQESILMKHLQTMKEKYARVSPGSKLEAQTLKELFLMDIKEGEGRSEKGAFAFHPSRGHAMIARDLFTGNFLSLDQAKTELKQVELQHRDVLKRLGIGADQVHKTNIRFRFVETAKDAGDGRIEPEGPAKVEGFITFASRAIDGILVEDSYLKVFSHDQKALAGLNTRWPKFQFHPGISSFELKSKTEIQEEILAHAKKVLNPKHEYNIKMAVVMRPATLNQQKVFIPALKVALLSRPPGGGEQNEMNGEAGERFYVNLVKQALTEDPSNQADSRE